MSSPEHKEKIWNFIKNIKTGMLVTKDEKIGVHARPMQLVQDHYDGTLWFFTNIKSDKVAEVQGRDPVCITFSNPKDHLFVSMTGHCNITQDKELINKFWSPMVAAWFTEGKDSQEVGLIEIKIHHGEHWDSDTNIFNFAYQMAKANIKHTTPNIGENEKF